MSGEGTTWLDAARGRSGPRAHWPAGWHPAHWFRVDRHRLHRPDLDPGIALQRVGNRLGNIRGAADGDFISDRGLGYYYAYWLLPIFKLYALPGVLVGGLLWSFTNVVGVWFAARVFGSRSAVVLAGFGTLSGF